MQQQLENLNAELSSKEKTLLALQADVSKNAAAKEALENEVAQLKAKIDKTNSDLETAQKSLEVSKAAYNAELEKMKKSTEEAIAARKVLSRFQQARLSTLKAELAKATSDLAQAKSDSSKSIDAQKRRIQQLQEELSTLQATSIRVQEDPYRFANSYLLTLPNAQSSQRALEFFASEIDLINSRMYTWLYEMRKQAHRIVGTVERAPTSSSKTAVFFLIRKGASPSDIQENKCIFRRNDHFVDFCTKISAIGQGQAKVAFSAFPQRNEDCSLQPENERHFCKMAYSLKESCTNAMDIGEKGVMNALTTSSAKRRSASRLLGRFFAMLKSSRFRRPVSAAASQIFSML